MDDITKRAQKLKARRDRVKAFQEHPDALDVICAHVASNGTLVELSAIWDIPFGSITNWIDALEERAERYKAARAHRDEWVKERVLKELRTITTIDIRKAYTKEGHLLPIHEMPDDIAASLHSIDVEENVDKKGSHTEHSITKKLKMYDKLKAIDMIGKDLGLFSNKVEVSGAVKFEDIVGASMPDYLKPPQYRKQKDDDSKE